MMFPLLSNNRRWFSRTEAMHSSLVLLQFEHPRQKLGGSSHPPNMIQHIQGALQYTHKPLQHISCRAYHKRVCYYFHPPRHLHRCLQTWSWRRSLYRHLHLLLPHDYPSVCVVHEGLQKCSVREMVMTNRIFI